MGITAIKGLLGESRVQVLMLSPASFPWCKNSKQPSKSKDPAFFIKLTMKTEHLLPWQTNNCAL
jgi:hypothetical protein